MALGLSLFALLSLGALDEAGRQSLFARAKHSIVILRQTTVTGERVAHGTGWVARADGRIVTNSHVAQLANRMEAVFANGTSLPVEGVAFDDPEHDLAVLTVSATDLVPLGLSDVNEPVEGSSVYVLGNPLGYDFSVAQGIVAAYRKDGLPKDLQTDAPDRHAVLQLEVTSGAGGSGSPVLDETGRVIGVIRAGMGRAGTMVFAVPLEFVREALTPAHLAGAPKTHSTFLWVNLAISAVTLLLGVVFFRRLKRRDDGPKRAVRKWSGYEE